MTRDLQYYFKITSSFLYSIDFIKNEDYSQFLLINALIQSTPFNRSTAYPGFDRMLKNNLEKF